VASAPHSCGATQRRPQGGSSAVGWVKRAKRANTPRNADAWSSTKDQPNTRRSRGLIAHTHNPVVPRLTRSVRPRLRRGAHHTPCTIAARPSGCHTPSRSAVCGRAKAYPCPIAHSTLKGCCVAPGGPLAPGSVGGQAGTANLVYSSGSITAMKASWGMSTDPTRFMRFLPSFCFSHNFRFRVISPP